MPQVGRNPLGGWSVVVMIACLGLQAVSGLFANDGAEAEGPLGFHSGRRPLDDKMKQRLDRVNKDDEEALLHFFASQQ